MRLLGIVVAFALGACASGPGETVLPADAPGALPVLAFDRLPADHPHGGALRETSTIDMIVLHTIGGPMCEAGRIVYTQAPHDAVFWRDDFARRTDASIHYVVDREGRIAQQRPENRTGGHVASAAHPTANITSIGIEMVNRGDGVEPFPEPLMKAVRALVKDIAARHGLGPEAIRTHAELDTRMETCAGVAFPRRSDPGPLFPLDEVKAAVAGRS